MRKYLTQHSLKAFTIKVPQDLISADQHKLALKKIDLAANEVLLFNRFVSFIVKNRQKNWSTLPVFYFLFTFYDIHFVKETKAYLEFDLILNNTLNQNILPKLRHALFNQYNALIGFTEVLNEEENLDDTSKLMLDRVSYNARMLYRNTQLIIEFEQLKEQDMELKSDWVEPVDFINSFLEHRKNKQLKVDLQFDETTGAAVNIENKPIRTALSWFFDTLNNLGESSLVKCKIAYNSACEIRFEYADKALVTSELTGEIDQYHRFINFGEMASQINHRIFMLLYSRLVADKLGADFEIETSASPPFNLIAKWRFPIRKIESTSISIKDETKENKQGDISEKQEEQNMEYPLAVREELHDLFLNVKDTFILDEWTSFANKLNRFCLKHQKSNMQFLQQIEQDIRLAIVGFDITSLQQISRKIEQISKSE